MTTGRCDRSILRLLKLVLVTLVCALVAPAFASAKTIVSLEWDDGNADQYQVGQMMASHGMTGTFFINSGLVGTSGKMTWSQLQSLAGAGNEIGGHTVSHADLPTLSTDEATRQICNDRVNLINQGFTVTDLAYPFGDYNSTVEQIAAKCGYNSARTIGGIVRPGGCSGCPYAEPVPPADPYATRTPDSIHPWETVQDIENLVTQAEQNGGGWVQLVMHHVCDGCDPTYAISPSTLSSVLDWLRPRAASGTVVENINQVIGGSVQPAVSGPAPPPPPSGSNMVWNPSFETLNGATGNASCYQLGGFGTNTAGWSPSTDAHTGSSSEQLTVSSYSSGDAKIITQQDLGQCAPTLAAGNRYQVTAWYKSTAPTMFTLYARNPLGGWQYWTQSSLLPAASSWTQATFTAPALPAGDTGISFGLGLVSNGTLTVDDYGLAAAPATDPSGNMLQNASLESVTASGVPTCFQTGKGGGTNTTTWTHSTTPHSGTYAEQAQVTAYTSGGAVLVSSQDAGSCAPTAKPGHSYAASVWYQADHPVYIETYYHDSAGWHFWKQSPSFPAASTYAQAKFTTPALPATADLVSIGLEMPSLGTMTMDDFSLSDADTTAPTVSMTSPSGGSVVGGTAVNLAATATAGQYGQIDHVEFLVDGQLVGSSSTAPYGFAWNSTSVPDGTHTLTARGVDWAGNTTVSAPVSVTVQNTPVDSTPPTVSLTAPSSGSAVGGNVSLAATASDNVAVSHVDFLVNGNLVASASIAPYTATWNSASAPDGTYTISARAVDTSGNIAEDPHTITVDNTPPSSSASAPSVSGSSSVTVSYSAADSSGGSGLAEVDLYAKGPGDSSYSKVASNTSGNGSGSFGFTAGEGDGAYSFYTRAVDQAGNVEPAHSGADATTTVDTTAPSSSASAPGYAKGNTWSVSYVASDATAGVTEVDLYAKGPNDSAYSMVSADMSGSGSGSFSYTASEGEGSYRFYTVSTDKAGNVESAPSSAETTTLLDTTAPSSSATAPAFSGSTAVKVFYNASDSGSGLASVDLYAQAPGDSGYTKVATDSTGSGSGSFTYNASAGDGSYSFYTVATDNAGNVESTPSGPQATTVLTTVAPSSSARAPSVSSSTQINISFTASASQDPSGLARVDLYAKAPGDSGYTLVASDLSGKSSGTFAYTAAAGDGSYSFYTVASDNAGNVESTPSSPDAVTLLDTTAPTSSASAQAMSNSSPISVSFTASDAGSGLAKVDLYAKAPGDSGYSKVANDSTGNGSGTFTYNASAGDGSYSFYTVATDNAGNVESAPASADATTGLDTVAPSSTASALASAFSAPVTVSYTAADNQGGSGLAEVDLYAKGPSDSGYAKVASDKTPGASGSFNYSPSEGNGSYSFYTVAIDKAGNIEAAPSNADAITSYLADSTAPTSNASSPASVTSATWNVSYTASDNQGGSGLASVELWVKPPNATSYSKAATNSGPSTSGSFSYTATAGDGSYAFYTVAIDQAGNREAAPTSPDATTVLDTQPPSAFQMSDPGQYLSAGVSLSLTSAPSDSGSGVASVTYQYRPSGSTGSWTNACKSTAAPWSCTWNTATSATPDGKYDLQAIATDGVGKTTIASNAPLTSRTIDNTKPAAKTISTTNVSGGTKGKLQAGDSMTFTYSETIKPSSILAAWTGAPTAVQVQMDGKKNVNSTLTVWNSAGTAQLPLANPLALGGIYNNSATVVFHATMVQNGSAITVTLGSISSGTVTGPAVTGGTLTWTPSASATDLAGNSATTTSVSAAGPAF